MKLKQRPEDFRVEELTEAKAASAGEYSFYRLDKTGWTTPDALAAIRRRWQLDFRRLSYGGLKDRHAVTAQYLTIFRGPRRDFKQERFTLTYLGQRETAYSAQDITANRFTIAIRALSDQALSQAIHALNEVAETGLANYFDDQRFGSVGAPPEFVAKAMVQGHFERALWLALAAPYEFDRAEAKREKALLRSHWGNWPACKAALAKGHARSLMDYLVTHPTDFKGAVARLRPDLQGLYLAAYQSYLWNRMLAEWLRRHFSPEQLITIQLKLGEYPVPVKIHPARLTDWTALSLPLPSARLKPPTNAPWLTIVADVLHGEGLTLTELKIKGLQKPFFSRGERAGCVQLRNLHHSVELDELNPGRRKLILQFDLPRGSYATMLVKRITTSSQSVR
jgi:tRNA pseudouridine13 synthase